MYTPINAKSVARDSVNVSFMGKKGVNLRDLPQLLNTEFALQIQNYLVTTDGGLIKRGGISELDDQGGTDGTTMIEKYTDDINMWAFGTSLYAYSKSSGTSTLIKNDFNTSDPYSGQKYGDYFFICNGGNKVGRVTQTLDYDAQTANFTTDLVVTGGTSGATAIVLEDSDSGATGTLTLGSITGVFVNDETITDSGTGSADVDGTLGYTFTEISTAPYAKVLKVIEARLFAANLRDDPTAVQYSEVDDGTNPPFDTWSIGVAATEGGKVIYRNAGTARSIESLGAQIIVFSDNAKFAFVINTIDSAGTLTKVDQFTMYREDFGGSRGSIVTDKGVFYVNENGLWNLFSVAQGDIPYNDQEFQVSVLLGKSFFDDLNLTLADIAYDAQSKYIYLTCRRDSSTNNFILGYNVEHKAVSFLIGWNLNTMTTIDNVIYGGDASTGKLYKCFDGFDDDGNDIYTVFEQELQTGNLYTRKDLLGFYSQGLFSPSTDVTISFNTFNRTGSYTADKKQFQWAGGGSVDGYADGYGSASWGSSPWGGDVDLAGTSENFNGCRPFIRNFQRLRVKLTSNDKSPHAINWFSIITKEKYDIRRRGQSEL